MMKRMLTFPARESLVLRETPPIYHATAPPPAKTRLAVFGSFLGGYHVLKELLAGPLAGRVKVVGVATDDPTQPFIHAERRLWKYAHSRDDELLVPRFAAEHGLPVFTGRVKTPEFLEMFLDDWRPSLCLMATFGQKIPTPLIEYPTLGFHNFHHSHLAWPSYPGPDPIRDMQRDGRTHLVLTIHKVSDVIDGGEFVARSHPVAIPAGINAIGMHRITWPQMGPFIRRAVGTMLAAAEAMPAVARLFSRMRRCRTAWPATADASSGLPRDSRNAGSVEWTRAVMPRRALSAEGCLCGTTRIERNCHIQWRSQSIGLTSAYVLTTFG